MNKNLIAALLVAASAALAAPAFASSGYGPAPSYNPSVGAPASQRGQSVQTVAAEQAQAKANATSYGGVQDTCLARRRTTLRSPWLALVQLQRFERFGRVAMPVRRRSGCTTVPGRSRCWRMRGQPKLRKRRPTMRR